VAVGDAGDALVDAIEARARALALGGGLEPSVDLGPVAGGRALDRVHSLLHEAERGGARVRLDGRRAARARGAFVGPTIVEGVAPGARLRTEAVGGPVLVVVRAADLDDAVAAVGASRV